MVHLKRTILNLDVDSTIVCRLCMSVCKETDTNISHLDRPFNIRSTHYHGTISSREMLNTLRDGQIYNDTNLPQNICENCMDSVLKSFLFSRKCEYSEQKWLKITEDIYTEILALETNVDNNSRKTKSKTGYILLEGMFKEFPEDMAINGKNMCKYLNQSANTKTDVGITAGINGDDFCITDVNSEYDIKIKTSTKKNKYKIKKIDNNAYACEHCTIIFKAKQYLISHLKTKHNIHQKVECNECGKKFNSVSFLRRHVTVHKTTDVYKCSVCIKVFNLGVDLENHITNEHHEKKIQCPECPELFNMKSEAKKHQMIVHDSGYENICKHCGKKFQSLARLLYHEERHKGVICEKCGHSFAFPYKLKLHAEKCPKNDEKLISCQHCSLTFTTREDARKHCKEAHTMELNYVCNTCNRNFTTAARLKCHLQRHMGVVCERCGRRYKYKSQLMRHTNLCLKKRKPGNPRPLQNYSEPQYICDYCAKGFNVKESLKAHIKSQHLFHNVYKCNICEKRFSYKAGLKLHMIIHTGERNKEQCNMCGKYFVTKPALVYHMRLHTGERPFQCDHCEETFLSASRRMAHVRTKHWGRTEECTICASKFFTPYAMRKHMSRHFNPNSKLFCSHS